MGTQFTSRFDSSDYRRIVSGIRKVQISLGIKSKKRRKPASLSSEQERQLGNAVVKEVFSAAESRQFFPNFIESTLFEEILDWLKTLWSDAYQNGFQGIIHQYSIETDIAPLAELSKKLSELANATDQKKLDPFRVPATSAARRVLAEAASSRTPASPADSSAQAFGRKLAAFHLRDIVQRYIRSFIHEFLSRVLGKADPNLSNASLQQAKVFTESTIEEIARRSITRAEKTEILSNSRAIHEVVVEELKRVTESGLKIA